MWRMLAGCLAVLAPLAGCASLFPGAPVIGPTRIDYYIPQSNSLFVGNGQLVLIGSADTPEARLQLAQIAADGIADGAFGAKFILTPRELAQRPSRNRVVVVMGGADATKVCTDPPAEGGKFAGTYLRVVAVACNGDQWLSYTTGSIGELKGIDDPRLRYLFTQIGYALFPGRNPDYLPQDRGDWDSF